MLLAGAPVLSALEVDPYLAWLADIPDSVEALNDYTNAVLSGHLQVLNERRRPPTECALVVESALTHLHSTAATRRRALAFIRKSPEVETWKPGRGPAAVWRSAYRWLPPLYVTSIAATIDLNGVRLSIDKIGHFFGFGRRYDRRYRRALAKGATPDEAERAIVLWGMRKENGLVGKRIDTIFSHADLEANYQGFRFARDWCEGPAPFIVQRDGRWMLTRDVDLRDYVNPGFDEGYNTNHFTSVGWLLVRARLGRYCALLERTEVIERSRYYDTFSGPSNSQRIIRETFAARGKQPQARHSLRRLCADEDAPRAARLAGEDSTATARRPYRTMQADPLR
jgi:hypothetical protein